MSDKDVAVVLHVTVKDRWRHYPAAQAVASAAGRQSFTDQDVVLRVQDVLRDVTKHDDTIAWTVTGVTET